MIVINPHNVQIQGVTLFSTNEYFPELNEDLIHYWKMDESDGNVAYPTVGSYTGSFASGSFVDGIINNGYESTNNGGLVVGNIVDLLSNVDITQIYTMNIWVKDTGSTSYQHSIDLFRKTNEDDTGWRLRLQMKSDAVQANGYILSFQAGINWDGPPPDTYLYLFKDGTYKVNTWNMITLTIDRNASNYLDYTDVKAYVNGQLITWNTPDTLEDRSLGFANSYSFKIGAGAYKEGPNPQANIVLDEAAIWDRVLSATDIQHLYSNGRGLQHPFENW